MNDLDLLKKDWQKPNTFVQISEQDIYGMLHKKSSSIVKWIFYVSIIELGLGLLIGFFLKFTKYDDQGNQLIEKMGLFNYYVVTSVIIYGVVIYFIYNFYKMYGKISVTDNAKQLILNILKTRKVVKQYILFNLSTFAILFMILGSFTFHQIYLDYWQKNGIVNPEISLNIILKSSLILIAITAIFTGVFWFFYKLIYGVLLKKLQRNYEELKKIDL